jgi:hypothetical protein
MSHIGSLLKLNEPYCIGSLLIKRAVYIFLNIYKYYFTIRKSLKTALMTNDNDVTHIQQGNLDILSIKNLENVGRHALQHHVR